MEAGFVGGNNLGVDLGNVVTADRISNPLGSHLGPGRIIKYNQEVIRCRHCKVVGVPASNGQVTIADVEGIQAPLVRGRQWQPLVSVAAVPTVAVGTGRVTKDNGVLVAADDVITYRQSGGKARVGGIVSSEPPGNCGSGC